MSVKDGGEYSINYFLVSYTLLIAILPAPPATLSLILLFVFPKFLVQASHESKEEIKHKCYYWRQCRKMRTYYSAVLLNI